MSFSISDILISVSFVLIAYIFAGYPVIMYILAKLFPAKHIIDDHLFPSVTLIVSAHNEENVIEEKLLNTLALDYPENLLTVLVVSDGSTDGTDDIVLSCSNPRIKLIRPDGHHGKTYGLNQAMEGIHSEIVVFSDANAMYDPGVVKNLVRHFADPIVGYVVGHAKYMGGAESSAGKSENAYWNLEILIKKWESEFSSVVGGDGAIYAIRTALYEPLLESDINDFVNPLQIVAKGYRGIFDPAAWCTEKPAGVFKKEFSRKVRISNRSFNGLLRVPGVCNPFRVGWFAFQVVSHKLLRWFLPFIILVQFIAALSTDLDRIAVTCIAFYGIFSLAALIGWTQSRNPTTRAIFYIPYYVALMNLALSLGIILRLTGRVITVWDTVRSESSFGFNSSGILPFLLWACCTASIARICFWYGYGGLFIKLAALSILYALFHTYVGYPACLGLLARIRPKPVRKDELFEPTVTLLVVAYNEERDIEAKLANSLALEYPENKLSIIVASDGSEDGTNDIVRRFAGDRVRLLDFPVNRGKISALNEAMEHVDSEIVVLSDANVMYDSHAVRKLVAGFADPRVGAVSGKVILLNSQLSYGSSENLYYRIEHYIQRMEGETGCLVGADGAMYAIRTSLFLPPPADTLLDDFVISMQIALQGMMVSHEPEAIGFERNYNEIGGEFRRKARIVAGGIQCLLRESGVPYPDQGLLFFKFVSHKLMRWILGPMTVTLLILLAYISSHQPGWAFAVVLYAGITVVVVGFVGQELPVTRKVPLVSLCHYLLMLNFASIVGCYLGLAGKQRVNWKKS